MDPYYEDWAERNSLNVGDIILSIDDNNINNYPFIKFDHSIRAASSIMVQKVDGSITNIKINHLDIPQQFFLQFVIPAFYFLLTLFLAIYLYFFKKKTSSLNILIIFTLAVSLAYISSSSSGRLDNFGLIVNGCSLLLCIVLLIHFLKFFFDLHQIPFIFKQIRWLYIFPFLSTLLSFIAINYPSFLSIRSFIILFSFILLLIMSLVILLFSYLKYKLPHLKILFINIIIPFLPFLLLYVLPKVLFDNYILSAEVSALFLLLIPFNFIFIQLTEQLFDLEYFISRLRYYISISLIASILIIFSFNILNGFNFDVIVLLNMYISLVFSLTILLYIKEKIDYHQRRFLFSTKGNYIHKLYKTIYKFGKSITVEELLDKFIQEVSLKFKTEDVYVVTYDYQKEHFTSSNGQNSILDNNDILDLINKLEIRDIKKRDNLFFAFIHQDLSFKRILVFSHKKPSQIKKEDLLWLELVLFYINNFIDNTKMVKELLEELKKIKDETQLPLLNKLLWLQFEEEKSQIAQELHDTNLQEQLHLAREIDLLSNSEYTDETSLQLKNIHKQMISTINDLRSYCEDLKPPLLNTIGLNAALRQLIIKVKERADFEILYSFDRLYLEDERLNLIIYRISQELLNNALKHSQATLVEINLKENTDGFQIFYYDNGVGFNLKDVLQTDSMGIRGITEKVKIFNGNLNIDTNHQEGLSIVINISERSKELDFTSYS
ncbi:histidine kinase [Lysinibacillus xylanilyticus]|uniref:histidine kinase n=1 Tax=Lysinibacillus xylanilyticus TaxID=582475 RepID=UPI00382C45A9